MFSENYPNLAWWINNHGWIELGGDDYYRSSWLRILDEGGMCWEDQHAKTLDEAVSRADRWASQEIATRFGEESPKRYDEEEQ